MMHELLHFIDSTNFRLGVLSADWARFLTRAARSFMSSTNPEANRPLATLSGPRVNDITAAKDMLIDPTTYVFDLGYYGYGRWAKLDAAGCRIVTRPKANTKLSNVIERAF